MDVPISFEVLVAIPIHLGSGSPFSPSKIRYKAVYIRGAGHTYPCEGGGCSLHLSRKRDCTPPKLMFKSHIEACFLVEQKAATP